MTGMATENDAMLDFMAALEMYQGSVGDDGVVIETVGEVVRDDCRHTLLVELSNGQRFEVRVREVA